MTYFDRATMAPAVKQGARPDFQSAGTDDGEDPMEAIPLPDKCAPDEAHARSDQRLRGWSPTEVDEP